MVGSSERDDCGAAMVDFALVAGLLTILFAGVLQLGLALHVRTTLIDCAASGARFGAFADRTPNDGAARSRELIAEALSPGFANQVTAGYETTADGVDVVVVRVRAPLPLAGLLGPSGTLDVQGRAVREDQ